jgi:hypothetical protein
MVEGLQSSGIAAGVYINNRVRIASLFRGIPEDRYDEVRNLFLCIRDETEVLKSEFSELADRINIQLPDEKSRRVGQSVAAASLPAIDQENR